MAVAGGLRMEIEIPLAGHDTETEGSQLSDQKMEIDIPSTDGENDTARTLTDKTLSERWSCEGQASFFTSRSLATSRTSQALSSTSQKGKVKGQPGGEMEVKTEVQVESQNEGQTEAGGNNVDETNSSRPTGNEEISCGDDTMKDENTDIGLLKSPTTTERDAEDRSFTEDTYRSTRLAAEEAADRYLDALRTNSADNEDTSEAGTQGNTGRGEAETQQDNPKTVPEEGAAGMDLTDTDQNEKEGLASTPGRVAVDDEGSSCPADSADQEKGTDEKSPLEEDSANKEDINSGTGDNDEHEKEQSNVSVKTPEQNSGDAGDSADAEEQQQDESGGNTSAVGSERPAEKEEQEGVFMTEGAPGPEAEAEVDAEEGSDISGARADTPNWDDEEGEGAEDDAASLSDLGGISQRLDPLSARSRPRPMTCTSELEGVAPGQRGVVNTPVSYFTTADYHSDVNKNSGSRNPSHFGVEAAREAAFQHAMTLMTSRCDSKQERLDTARLHEGRQDGGYGPKGPQYFYVDQGRPCPMAPLKVWQGYGGNIYFQPMQIHQVGSGKGSNQEAGDATHLSHKPPASKVSCKSAGSRLTRTTTSVSRSRALVPVDSGESVVSGWEGVRPVTRSGTHMALRRGPTSAKSKASSRSVAAISQHLVLYLDKQAVTHPDNSSMNEELQVIEQQQSTGSLNLQQGGPGKPGRLGRSGARSAKFDRICRGSVAHHLRRAKSGGPLGPSVNSRTFLNEKQQEQQSASPGARVGGVGGAGALGELMVIGDKFCPPTVMSPLLRAQTQFSHSSQRMTVNSPDIYSNYERLPPLEQMRVSLRHMDSANSGRTNTPYSSGAGSGFGVRVNTPYSTGGSMGVVEDLKPFIKYSPDVKVQYNRQLKFC